MAWANQTVCPACRRINDDYPAGIVELSGSFFAGHKEEILNLLKNEEVLEKKEHPMERIIKILEEDKGTVVSTTGIHLARRLGDAVNRAYQWFIKSNTWRTKSLCVSPGSAD